MGCICSAEIDPGEDGSGHRTKSLNRMLTVSKKDEVVAAIIDVAVNGSRGNTPRFLSKAQDNVATTLSLSPDEGGKKRVAKVADRPRKVVHQRRATTDVGVHKDGSDIVGISNNIEVSSGIVDVPNGFVREHAAAGWPSWLTSVAGEAVKGWLPRKANSFEKLDKVRFFNLFQLL